MYIQLLMNVVWCGGALFLKHCDGISVG